ncbi:MAG: ATP-binding protein, partial [Gammaproteobacteria bacterium]|nr:ATP-binding protein [Gammaproteobacteria bacterium]
MNNWDIRQQIIALALLPVIVVAIGLTSYFTISQLDFLTASQTRHGNLIARQLAPVSEYAVFSGNIASLDTILKNILSDEDIISIKITDTNHKTITSLSDNEKTKIQNTIWHKLAFEELKVFKQPIKTQILNVGLLEDDNNNSNNNEETIGYIELTLTSTNINAKKLQTVIKGSLITLFILLMSMLLALRLSKQISKPVQTLTNTVKRISSGDYKIRIDEQAPGDLGTLESCVNIMTEELQYSRKHLEAKINEATKELHETMEELEIRNAELDIARSKALQTSQAKTEFLANMSHELRTPLGGILGFSELLEKTSLESQQRDYSDIIKKSAHNLLNIIDGVLDLSKIESGKLEINSSEFNVIDIIEEVIDLLTPIAYEKNLELFYYFDINASHIINSDPVRIRQILINLIGNAIKFTEKGFISLHISSYQEDDLSTIIKFSIKDTGIGMDQSQQERLFNAFTQADKSIERKFGGTGLGLVISKKLAQLLQGDISFESQKNSGTTFTLTLPTKTAKQIKPGTELAGKKICFIDPQCSCEKGIQSLLNFWACNVTSYNKIPDDLSNFDLIIVSICRISMSKEKIKSLIPLNNTNIPILAVVSTRSHKELINIKNYGFNDAVFRSSKQELIHQSLLNLVSDASPAEPEPTIAAHYFDWSELNILVVDDNDINLKLADIILTKNGARVITESTGQGGIDRSNEQFFDLIFMDL